MELFRHLLSREELEDVRLDPLRLDLGSDLQADNVVHDIDEAWQQMALAAIEQGFSEQEIVSATHGGGSSWSGSMSSMFAARAAPFEKLLQHSDARLVKIGKMGFEQFSKLRDEQLACEKHAEIRG